MPRLDVKSWIQDERGSSLTITAIGMVMALGVSALAVDMGNAYVMKTKLQASADSAALAAAGELPDQAEAVSSSDSSDTDCEAASAAAAPPEDYLDSLALAQWALLPGS